LKWNEAKGGYDFGPIDWEEFRQVISGNGPCNAERIAARKQADDNGQWVREAASAFAEKRSAKKAS
jgi:ring-1,2-phenylacetyl-CoA epoxidase subunit PaaA